MIFIWVVALNVHDNEIGGIVSAEDDSSGGPAAG